MNLPAVESKCRAAIEFALTNGKEVASDGGFDADCLCLVGCLYLQIRSDEDSDEFALNASFFVRRRVDSFLRVSTGDRRALEAGFSGWKADEYRNDAPELYDLGSRLAAELKGNPNA